MTIKPVAPRAQALRDVEEAMLWYAEEAGEDVALHFLDALEEGYATISTALGTGSPRYAHRLDIPGLRTRAFATLSLSDLLYRDR